MREYTSTIIITEDVNMEKYIYDKNNVLWYELQGDYYIPCLTVPAKEERHIRIWGQRHLEETGRQGTVLCLSSDILHSL